MASAAALLLSLLLGWYSVDAGARTLNAWQAFPKLDVALAAAALAAFAVIASPAGVWRRPALAAIGSIAAGAVVFKLVDPPAYPHIEPRVGPFLAAAAASGLVIAAALRPSLAHSPSVRQGSSPPGAAPRPSGLDPPPSIREIAVVSGLLVVTATAAYGTYVRNGAFDNVGWAHAAMYRAPGAHGFLHLGAFSHLNYRPLARPYFSAVHGLFGLNTELHLAWAVLLGIIVSLSAFCVVRTLGLERVPATAIAVLLLVFPASSAARLGTTHSIASLAVSCYLIGLLCVFRGFRSTGRAALGWHAAAGALFAATLLTYEITAGAIAASVLLYLAYTRNWQRAIRRWLFDLSILALCVAVVTLRSTPEEILPPARQVDKARLIGRQAVDLGATLLAPVNGAPIAGLVPTVAILVVVALLLVRLLPATDRARLDLQRGLVGALGAATFIACAYLPFVAADPWYAPLQGGEADRVNALAAVGYATLIVVLAALAGLIVFHAHPQRRIAATVVMLCFCAFVAVGFIRWLDQERDVALAAAADQRRISRIFREKLGRLPPHSTVFLYGTPAWLIKGHYPMRSGWPVFAEWWDLSGALRLARHDWTVRAYPLGRGDVRCGQREAYPQALGPTAAAPYKRGLLLLDAVTGQRVAVASRRACTVSAARLRTGGLLGQLRTGTEGGA